MSPFSAVGLELWSMTSDIFFDNFFITDDRNTAERWANDGWGLKKAAEGAAEVQLRLKLLALINVLMYYSCRNHLAVSARPRL